MSHEHRPHQEPTEPPSMPAARVGEDLAPDDPRLAPYRDLRDADLAARLGGEGWFIGEQALVVERMLRVPGRCLSVLASERMAPRAAALIAASADPAVPLLVAPQSALESITGFPLHRGLLALGRRPADGEERIAEAVADRKAPTLLLACEEIRNIDNIGLLFRNAAAFGVAGVLLSPGCHDPLYRKSLRVSIGHALEIPFMRLSPWPQSLQAFADRHACELLGAATIASAVPIGRVPRTNRAILAIGSEFSGLAAETLRACRSLVRIPMAAGVDSLNAAVAAGICLSRLSEHRLDPHADRPPAEP
jgi:tRNA G18 (ribose-2'-O)-methylase SpoU